MLNQVFFVNVFLLSVRLATVFLMTPILYAMDMPASARVLLVIALSLSIAMGMTDAHASINLQNIDSSAGALIASTLYEAALGAVLALGVLLAFAAFSVAGRLLDIQIGFGIAEIFDPVTHQPLPILTSTFNQLAIVVFFTVNGHHALLRGLVYSLERFPLGRAWPIAAVFPVVLKQVSGLFTLGFALAAPVVFCILMVEISLGVVARNLPQMNMFAMGVPVKVCVGLVTLAIWQTDLGAVMSRIYGSIYTGWSNVFDTAVRMGSS